MKAIDILTAECSFFYRALLQKRSIKETTFCLKKVRQGGIDKTRNTLNEEAGRALRSVGWLRLVGSLKSYVLSAEYSTFYRAFFAKRVL